MSNSILITIALMATKLIDMNTERSSQGLGLNIQTEKDTYAVGESIWLKISLRNTGNKTIYVPKCFMLPANDPKNNLIIQVIDSSGRQVSRISHMMTGRALYYPNIQIINSGESYVDSILLAGNFTQKIQRKKYNKALWSLGENPEITSTNEYPAMTPGTFEVRVIYEVDKAHLVSLKEEDRKNIWQGNLNSNTIKFSIK